VGSALVPKLRAAGHFVNEVDLQWFRQDPEWHKVDVRHIKRLPPCDCIIHLAAISNDPSVSYYPRLSWETSVLATQQLAQMAVKTDCRFIYASSVSVYGADRGMVTEDMDVHPLSDYNKTKICAERVLLSYPALRVQIVRPATICGLSPRMRLDLTVNMFTMQALTKGVITVHGGQQYRPSIHIDDMTNLYLWLLDTEAYGIANAGFENHSLIELAEKVKHHTGARIQITDQKDIRSYQVNSDILLNAGFKPKLTVDNAIDDLCEAYHNLRLLDKPEWYNLGWMRQLGIKDE
jgi:nucleoside-diphosphate-sugar epimerase